MTTKRAPAQAKRTAGQRLSDELSRDGDSITVRELIGHAAQFADLIERCDELISGKRSAWMHIRVNSDQVVEVKIGDAVRERRQLTTELRHLLGEIHKQRAGIPMGGDDDDVLDDGDS
jgi:hypothetical protein